MITLNASQQRILANKQEYDRLKADPNYTDVKFDSKTGGLLAIHKDHNFDPTIGKFGIPRGDYERIATEVLYGYGRGVILDSEISSLNVKVSEGLLDGKKFDIKGVEGVGGRNIIDKISQASKQGAETVVLYFHDPNMFDIGKTINAYRGYLNLSKNKQIQTVYYIVEGKLYKITIKNADDKSSAQFRIGALEV
jgi:hypothetical protein